MRRLGLFLGMMVAVIVAGAGIAFAAVEHGTDGRDLLVGTGDGDVLFGRGGGDGLAGKEGDDVLHGQGGRDFVHGGRVGWGMAPDGRDRLFGGEGPDCVFGGSEDDVLHGGGGRDDMGHYCYEFIFDTGNDAFFGGGGNDHIIALEDRPQNAEVQERDLVFCGAGTDTVYYQKGVDRIRGCEKKNPF